MLNYDLLTLQRDNPRQVVHTHVRLVPLKLRSHGAVEIYLIKFTLITTISSLMVPRTPAYCEQIPESGNRVAARRESGVKIPWSA